MYRKYYFLKAVYLQRRSYGGRINIFQQEAFTCHQREPIQYCTLCWTGLTLMKKEKGSMAKTSNFQRRMSLFIRQKQLWISSMQSGLKSWPVKSSDLNAIKSARRLSQKRCVQRRQAIFTSWWTQNSNKEGIGRSSSWSAAEDDYQHEIA